MHPILFRIGSLEIHTYGVLVATGFLLGIITAAKRAKTAGIEPERINDLGVWLIVAGMFGGKLFHVVFFWNDFLAGWRAAGLASLREGFVFYGGFIAASVACIAYARLKKLSLARLADAFAPSVALGHAFGRLGCFFEGCCYGKACSLPWAVHGLHPTQLYEAAGNFAIFAALAAFYRHRKPKRSGDAEGSGRQFDGQVWWLYLGSYGALRFGVEFFRGDYDGGVFHLGHYIAAVMMLTALVGWKLCRRSA